MPQICQLSHSLPSLKLQVDIIFLQIIPKFYTLRAWVQPLTLEEDWALVLPLIDASLICVTPLTVVYLA